MSIRTTYQNIREQLVSLTVDLEEKENIIKVLTRKNEHERDSMGRIEEEFNNEYNVLFDNQTNKHKVESESLFNSSTKLMNSKKELLQECQDLVELLKENEKEIIIEGNKIHHESDESLEQEKRIFRQGQEARLEKFLASKASEYKESTSKAIQPEIARLKLQHEKELSDIEAKGRSDERSLRESFAYRLKNRLEEEKKILFDSHRQSVNERSDTITKEIEAADREHRYRVFTLQEDLDKELERIKSGLSMKMEKERERGQYEIKLAQEKCQSRLNEIRKKHTIELEVIRHDHEEKVKYLKQKFANNRKDIEENFMNDDTESSDITGDDNEKELIRHEVQEIRDKRLQVEIRQLQAETVRLERGWKNLADIERTEINDIRIREENESKRKQKQLTDEMADLSRLEEELSIDIINNSQKVSSVESEIKEIQKEIQIYDAGITAHRLRMSDAESLHRLREKDEMLMSEKRINELRQRCDRLNSVIKDRISNFEIELSNINESHSKNLDDLDLQIKADVARKDEEIEYLRDLAHTEKIKLSRLEKLLKDYASTKK